MTNQLESVDTNPKIVPLETSAVSDLVLQMELVSQFPTLVTMETNALLTAVINWETMERDCVSILQSMPRNSATISTLVLWTLVIQPLDAAMPRWSLVTTQISARTPLATLLLGVRLDPSIVTLTMRLWQLWWEIAMSYIVILLLDVSWI